MQQPRVALDRRTFLALAASSLVCRPTDAFGAKGAQPGARKKVVPNRLVVVFHPHGRVAGNGSASAHDVWSPRATSGALPPGLSPLLAALEPVRGEIVSVDGIDNIVRHATGDADGHLSDRLTALTCVRPTADGRPGGPSIDHVAGARLRATAQARAALVFPASPTAAAWEVDLGMFAGAGGTAPLVLSSRPEIAAAGLATEPRGPYAIRGATPVDPASVPAYDIAAAARGRLDDIVTPWQIKNLVQALACDVTRVACLGFELGYDPVFASEFPNRASPFEARNWHDAVHNSADPEQSADVITAFQHYGKMFVRLIGELAAVRDRDNRRLLDNTLVLWVSDLGYGASHEDFNIPVVLAGMRGAFPRGQGRHVAVPQRSLGDLFAQVLRMLGGTDATFGETGTLADIAPPGASLAEWAARPGLGPTTPLHFGPIEL